MSGVPAEATIRFYGDLADLARDADRDGQARVFVERPRSVKDAIESCGVPHTEVDLVLSDGDSVDFGHQLSAGDHIAVYPQFTDLDVPSRVRPDPLPALRFVLDVHLGRLAQRLRVLGFDAAYRNDADDAELAAQSVTERRWLLTRDRGLLMRATVRHGYLLRASDPRAQAREVVRRFDAAALVAPFTRCARCNARLERVPKAAIVDRLEPGTRRDHDVFARCTGCARLYWEGSHAAALHAFVDEATAPDTADEWGAR